MGVPGSGRTDSTIQTGAVAGLNYIPADIPFYTADIPIDPLAFEESDLRNTAFSNLLAGMGRDRGGQLNINPVKLDDSVFHLSKDEVAGWHSKHDFLTLPSNYDIEQWFPAEGVDEALATQISAYLEYKAGLNSAYLFAKGPLGNYLINSYNCDGVRSVRRLMADIKESLKNDPDTAKKVADIVYAFDTGIIVECNKKDQERKTVWGAAAGFVSIVAAFFVVGPKVHKWIEKPCDPKKETCPLPPPLLDYRGKPIQPGKRGWRSAFFDNLTARAAKIADDVATQAPVYAAAIGAGVLACAAKVETIAASELNAATMAIYSLQEYIIDESNKFGNGYSSGEGF